MPRHAADGPGKAGNGMEKGKILYKINISYLRGGAIAPWQD